MFCSGSTTRTTTVRRPWASRPLDLVFYIYFMVHIPTTILIDSQIVLPSWLYPQPLLNLSDFWHRVSGDPLMAVDQFGLDPNMVWLYTFVVAELVLQLPFFFYAARELYWDSPCIRLPLGLYGAHVATTTLPILVSAWFGYPELLLNQRYLMLAVYSPYFLVPLLMVLNTLCWAVHSGHGSRVINPLPTLSSTDQSQAESISKKTS
ncbi:Transmembrane protein 97 [Dispira parvispora]|uniref:Transmembrane protein 97 n=1 Tax=Dispira parvispora TaxID=1520584 RepID=A0A9W8EAF1_9FUNG|nr:Transmembrane protein 97 [Dispira parvispora]